MTIVTTQSAVLPVTQAVIAQLNTPSGAFKTACPNGAFDYVPQGTTFPYGRVGDVTEVPFNALGGVVGKELTAMVHLFSQQFGDAEIGAMANAAIGMLDRVALTITGWTLTQLGVQFESTAPGEEVINAKITRHWIQQFRIYVRQN